MYKPGDLIKFDITNPHEYPTLICSISNQYYELLFDTGQSGNFFLVETEAYSKLVTSIFQEAFDN